ncbi:MAG: type II secretion system F family protein [Oscillospiraceae bacterium]|nr:type II secretion system F family protein [Oscillospiraceae bacterium]
MNTITPDYKQNPTTAADNIIAFALGFAAGFFVLFIFYKLFAIAAIGGAIVGTANIFVTVHSAINRRLLKLRTQFFDLLEAMSVAMRAGNPMLKSLASAKKDLMLIYPADSDIIAELNLIIGRFNNAVPLSESFSELAERSGLEDITSFATIYKTIEGKSGRADEIIRQTQQIISEKMEIEMEIDTMMTAAKTEVKIMLFMPLVILGLIGYAGAGFMDAIYTTGAGRIVSTAGLAVFAISFILARKYSNVSL